MPITPLPTPPLRSDGPTTFADRGDTFMAALPAFVTQANAAEANVDAKEASAVASAAAASQSAAAAAVSAAGANFKGNWSALTGALAMPASVAHNGSFWALNVALANVITAVPGVSASWTKIKVGADVYTYANRANLRSLSPAANDQAIVEGLGLFVWYSASAELDDGETCFATASGRWLMQATAPEYVHGFWTADIGIIESNLATSAAGLAALDDKFLRGSFTMSLTTLAATTSTAFTATVTGAAVGDSVIVTPGNVFGTSAADASRLSFAAHVSAADTATISIRNASATSASMTASTWQVLVIKP